MIDPWDCKYFESDEVDEEGEIWWDWVYYCNSTDNNNGCNLDPRGGEQECNLCQKRLVILKRKVNM